MNAASFLYRLITSYVLIDLCVYDEYYVYIGYETYTIFIKNLKSGAILEDRIEGSDGNIVWDRDSSRLYYLTMDEEHRPDKLYMHVLGTSQSDDVCLYTEEDGK